MKQLIANDWKYLNEGNQNIILEYQGNYDQNFINKVLRLRKPILSEGLNCQINDNLEELIYEKIYKEIPSVKSFINMPINLEKFLKIPFTSQEKQEFIKEITLEIETKRPEFRKSKNIQEDCQISIEQNLADCQSLKEVFKEIPFESFVVEIKPKCPLKDLIAEEDLQDIIKSEQLKETPKGLLELVTQDLSTMRLKFGQVQLQKLEQGSIKEISKYDPRELFSNNPELIAKTLDNLILTPQNNLRVKQTSQKIEWKPIIQQILLENQELMDVIVRFQNLYRIDKNKIKAIEPHLLEIQKLEQKDLRNIIECSCKEIKNEILNKQQSEKVVEEEFATLFNPISNKDIKMKSVIKLIMRFLISYTWRDLSIMFQLNIFDKISNDLEILLTEKQFNLSQKCPGVAYKIGLVDLELKGISKIEQIIQNEKVLLKLYIMKYLLK